MALTNAEKQAAWRARQAENKNRVAELERRIQLLTHEASADTAARSEPTALRESLLARWADGKWHRLDDIAHQLKADESRIARAIDEARRDRRIRVDTKRVGTDGGKSPTTCYRMFKPENPISASEIAVKLAPIVDGLIAEGKKNMATMSPATVATLAGQLTRLMDDWSGTEPAVSNHSANYDRGFLDTRLKRLLTRKTISPLVNELNRLVKLFVRRLSVPATSRDLHTALEKGLIVRERDGRTGYIWTRPGGDVRLAGSTIHGIAALHTEISKRRAAEVSNRKATRPSEKAGYSDLATGDKQLEMDGGNDGEV
jgi:hypothetical protein